MTSRVAPVGAAAAAAAWVAFASWTTRPGATSGFPIACPFKHVTGLDCPGCGSTRALGALTRLDVAAAFDHNAVVPVALLFIVAAWATWAWAVWQGRSRADLPSGRWQVATVGLVLVAFAVLRNLPAAGWLGSGLSSG